MIDQNTAVTITGFSVMLIIALNVYKFIKDQKLEAMNKGREEGSLSAKIDSLLHKVDAVSLLLSNLEKSYHEMNHKIDDHEKRLKSLEVVKKPTMADIFE